MKTIEIKIPDEFTPDQITFIKESAISQIEAEMKRELKIPQADIEAVETEVETLKTAMGIVKEPEVIIEEVIK